jgi:hypothetical protein
MCFVAVLGSTVFTSIAAPRRCHSAKIKCGKCPLVAFVMGCVWFWSSIHIRIFLFRSVRCRFVLERLMDGDLCRVSGHSGATGSMRGFSVYFQLLEFNI